jgi:hypothetical protein
MKNRLNLTNRRAHVTTLTKTVEIINRLDFGYLTGGSDQDIITAKYALTFAPILKFLAMPLLQNQICWLCGTGEDTPHTSSGSLSIFEDYEHGGGYEVASTRKCGFYKDVVSFWYWIVKTCYRRLPNANWSNGMAARSLLNLMQQNIFDLDTILDRTSSSERNHNVNNPITQYERKLQKARAIGESRSYDHPSLALPNNVYVSYGKVITDRFSDADRKRLIWIANNVEPEKGKLYPRAHTVDYYLGYKTVQDASFWIPCYLTKDWRNRENLGERIFAVLDWDKRFTKEQQHWASMQLSKLIPLLYLLDTGGKGLHAAYDTYNFELRWIYELYKTAIEDYGLDDIVAFRPEQPVRFPGGYNRKHGRRQNILIWNKS